MKRSDEIPRVIKIKAQKIGLAGDSLPTFLSIIDLYVELKEIQGGIRPDYTIDLAKPK